MRVLLLCFALFALTASRSLGEDWPQFRGPTGQGLSAATGLPLTWGEGEHIAWKTPVPGLGWSSPSIQGNEVWLTTALDDGKSLRAVCLDKNSGEIRQNVEVFAKENPGPVHSKNSHASPTPFIHGDRVFVHFGAHGTACLSRDGEILWKRVLEYNHRHGPAGSPILIEREKSGVRRAAGDDLLILSCDGTDVQYVVGLNARTGEIEWKSDRDGSMAYSTPLLIEVNGKRQVVSAGGEWVIAYEPETGKEIWRVRYPGGYSVVPRPVYGKGLVFVSSGYNNPVLYAIRPDGSGDVTETHVAWTLDRNAPHNPSPLLVGEDLYIVSDGGIATCLDAETGKVHWRERLGGKFSASPLFADGRIYFLNEEGTSIVIAPGTEYQELAKNKVDGVTLASLAVSDSALFLRTDTHLYRVE